MYFEILFRRKIQYILYIRALKRMKTKMLYLFTKTVDPRVFFRQWQFFCARQWVRGTHVKKTQWRENLFFSPTSYILYFFLMYFSTCIIHTNCTLAKILAMMIVKKVLNKSESLPRIFFIFFLKKKEKNAYTYVMCIFAYFSQHCTR